MKKKLAYTLANAEETHREFPRTFSIPRSEQRENPGIGQLVKLIFRPRVRGSSVPERMWVIVRRKTSTGYEGVLDNSPASIKGLDLGDKVTFKARHVIAFIPMGKQLELPFGQFAFVSPSILKSRAWPRLATRGLASSKGDSGWKVHSKSRPKSSDKLRRVSIDALIDRYPVLDSVLDERAGTSWRWDQANLEYKAC